MTHRPEELAALVRRARKQLLWEPGRQTRSVNLGPGTIERILPHRDPFLLVDTITAIDLGKAAMSGRRAIRHDDPVLAGHFPGRPIYPGVLQIEMLGQLGVCLVYFASRRNHEIASDDEPAGVRFLKVHHALFQAEVLPGDELVILATLLSVDDYTAICAGQLVKKGNGADTGQTICALAVTEVYFVDQ